MAVCNLKVKFLCDKSLTLMVKFSPGMCFSFSLKVSLTLMVWFSPGRFDFSHSVGAQQKMKAPAMKCQTSFIYYKYQWI